MQVPLLDLKAQYTSIESEVLAAVSEVLASQQCIGSHKVAELEEKIAAKNDCKFAVGASSGTDAILNSFIDVPVKTYSSGMHARLGFSIAVNIERDIMLIDEVLGVGDRYFREKCERKMSQFKERAKTIILVSHNTEAIKSFCNRAILLDKGIMIAEGQPEDVVEQYLKS